MNVNDKEIVHYVREHITGRQTLARYDDLSTKYICKVSKTGRVALGKSYPSSKTGPKHFINSELYLTSDQLNLLIKELQSVAKAGNGQENIFVVVWEATPGERTRNQYRLVIQSSEYNGLAVKFQKRPVNVLRENDLPFNYDEEDDGGMEGGGIMFDKDYGEEQQQEEEIEASCEDVIPNFVFKALDDFSSMLRGMRAYYSAMEKENKEKDGVKENKRKKTDGESGAKKKSFRRRNKRR